MSGPGEQGNGSISVIEFAEAATGLTDLQIIAPSYLAEALITPFADGELDGSPPYDNLEGLAASHREQSQAGWLPPHLADFDVFCARYRELMQTIPDAIQETFNRMPDEGRLMLAELVAQTVAVQTVRQSFNLDSVAGVRVADDGRGRYGAETLTGFRTTVPIQTRTVVEYGPGLAGTTRRAREALAGTWLAAHLLNGTPFAGIFAAQLGPMLGVPSGALRPFDDGMAAGARQLAEQGVQADMVIAAKVGIAPAEELEPAVRAAHDILVPGGALVLSDFANYPNTHFIATVAVEHFGPPAETQHAAYVTRKGKSLPMHNTVFIRR